MKMYLVFFHFSLSQWQMGCQLSKHLSMFQQCNLWPTDRRLLLYCWLDWGYMLHQMSSSQIWAELYGSLQMWKWWGIFWLESMLYFVNRFIWCFRWKMWSCVRGLYLCFWMERSSVSIAFFICFAFYFPDFCYMYCIHWSTLLILPLINVCSTDARILAPLANMEPTVTVPASARTRAPVTLSRENVPVPWDGRWVSFGHRLGFKTSPKFQFYI